MGSTTIRFVAAGKIHCRQIASGDQSFGLQLTMEVDDITYVHRETKKYVISSSDRDTFCINASDETDIS